MSLFPMTQPQTVIMERVELPLFREVAWDFERDMPIWVNGTPQIVQGKDAVLVWAWNALNTERFRYEAFSWQFGNELDSLTGQNFSDDLKRAEATRYIRECLVVSPYIQDVKDIAVEFENGVLKISGTIVTIYGEVGIYV